MFSSAVNQGSMNQGVETIDLAENKLIQSAVTGNMDAFNRLVVLHQDNLYWWVYSLVKDEAQAEDIAQLTFITAYEKLHSFRSGSFKAWLFTIARNLSYDELRRKKRRPSFSLDTSEDDDLDHMELLPDGAPLPEESLLASEQAEMVERMLSSLPVVFQQVVRLIELEGLEYHDAAKILNLPLGTVKSRLTRARLKMRSLFKHSRLL